MFFRKRKKDSLSLKKVDKLVTWIILASAVAGVIWLSQTKKWKEVIKEVKEKNKWFLKKSKNIINNSVEVLWKTLAKVVDTFKKK